ncbi:TetR/AcrR family transcriptional regulator [Alishewanella sp. 16-MA]|uniref:TetR/AcrR family transcriptional regulator n=1 Tax=Alishewanella maricola TaxID=2795740 RepID=A0ABS8BZ13_9ALTE|nr:MULTISPECIES: TetR/AcrR family transcriptional regulator [Gammaproteobacteria]MDP4945441.1 TetR/AcrR family transcriptional regulator [Alishewanella sp.]MCB5225304.1 TetR/AcrR family transcriptional regulator [Alishewanella maricola]MCC5450884.1 TetR/AcrR family transcriptional regulator [Rheinheimera sp. UJ51]MCF4008443.1 TetR/AcrR family transcriptional regulator [Rheinheimera sp. UJ63]MDP5036912.1 TetR/AcrR family transcriptional regulator [Alishewanella sp.]
MEKKLRTKDRILQASIALFNEVGERQVTTNHIAAHLGISPGNLYYHFRNKEDIVRQIFREYAKLLDTRIKPPAQPEQALDLLTDYLDAVFELMWRFQFFYANLPDILARDPALQQDYLHVQQNVLARVMAVIKGLNDAKVIAIEPNDIRDVAHNIKLLVSFWISYLKTQAPLAAVNKANLYRGVLKVLLLFKPYATAEALPDFRKLQQHYTDLAGSDEFAADL